MPEYKLQFARSARKELEALPTPIVRRILPRIESLLTDPRPAGCKKLIGTRGLWRIRVGDYRVIYSILDEIVTIEVIAVRHRGDAYS
jgi:mRNA interferase RelE/StbE